VLQDGFIMTIDRFDTYPLPPVFSLALSRPTRANPLAGGLLAIGGIPDIPHDDNWVSTPIIPRVRGKFLFYSILVDGFVVTPQAASTEPLTKRIRRSPKHVLRQAPVDSATFGTLGEEGEAEPVSGPVPLDPTFLPGPTPEPTPDPEAQPQPASGANPGNKIQMTIDSGATNMYVHLFSSLDLPYADKTRYLSTEIADYLASLFSPPATFSPRSNAYTVPCSAIPPRFAVVIEGVAFYVDPQDLVLGLPGSVKKDRMDAGMGEVESNAGVGEGRMCALSVQRSGTGDSVLGDAWLKGVIAVFDVSGELCFLFDLRRERLQSVRFPGLMWDR
jgi:hypothetical protein